MDRIRFTVPGPIPSKSNFRWDSNGAREKWRRIKQYEQDVGVSAMVAGAKSRLGKGCKARIHITLVNQRCDLDNAIKSPIDGLKGVAIEDDSPKYVDQVAVVWEEDGGGPRAAYEIVWAQDIEEGSAGA